MTHALVYTGGTVRHPVRSVALLSKDGNVIADDLRAAAASWFARRGVPCQAFAYTAEDQDLASRLQGVDLVVVLGGDGTLVSVTRQLTAAPRPVLGVNLGRVGFLTEICPEAWQDAFEAILREGVLLEKGMALRYNLLRGGTSLVAGIAVNDIVISRGGPARLVSLALTVGGIRLAVLRADGLILSTPTGSTGYTGSARGPLLYPGLEAYAVTPICPFLSNFLVRLII